jgi:hypothetical protein
MGETASGPDVKGKVRLTISPILVQCKTNLYFNRRVHWRMQISDVPHFSFVFPLCFSTMPYAQLCGQYPQLRYSHSCGIFQSQLRYSFVLMLQLKLSATVVVL